VVVFVSHAAWLRVASGWFAAGSGRVWRRTAWCGVDARDGDRRCHCRRRQPQFRARLQALLRGRLCRRGRLSRHRGGARRRFAPERAGLIGLGLEGYMLGGAFAAALGSYYGHSAWLGMLAGIAGGAALALVYGVSAIRFRADQVVMCIAVNLLVVGATRFFLRLAFGSSSNSPRVVGFGAEQSGTGVAALLANPMIW